MKNFSKYILLFVIIIGAGLYLYISQNRITASSPSDVLSVSEKSYSEDIHGLKRSGDHRVIKSIQATKDEPKLLELRVVYTYDGAEGAEVSTCGGVINVDLSYSAEWSCMPSRLKTGEHTALYRIKLLDDKPADYYCTDSVRVDMYKHGGSTFFNQMFNYKKAWVDGESFYAQLKQLIYRYTKCS